MGFLFKYFNATLISCFLSGMDSGDDPLVGDLGGVTLLYLVEKIITGGGVGDPNIDS